MAFDIGGVLSKDVRWKKLIEAIGDNVEVFIITDMHDKEEVMRTLVDNGVDICPSRVYCADYASYGEMCKAVLLKQLKIDFLFDDFVGYVQWDSSLGAAPIRCLVMPDARRPYWHENWKCKGGDFGRRKYSE